MFLVATSLDAAFHFQAPSTFHIILSNLTDISSLHHGLQSRHPLTHQKPRYQKPNSHTTMAYNSSMSTTSKNPQATPKSTPTNPRDLLWHHQLKREHQHLLSLIKAQESHTLTELGSLKQQFLDQRNRQDRYSKAILELREDAATVAGESDNHAERERQVLERVEGLERETGGLGRKIVGLEQWVGETEERAVGVEGRVRGLEERPMVGVNDVAGLKRKIDVMENETVRKKDVGKDGLRLKRPRSHQQNQQQQQSPESRSSTTSQMPSEDHIMEMIKPEDLQKWIMLSDETEKGYKTRLTHLWNDLKNSLEDPELYRALSKYIGVKLADWKANTPLGNAQHNPEILEMDKRHGETQKTDSWVAQVQGYGDDTMALNKFPHQRMVTPHPNYPNSMAAGAGNGKPSADDDDLYAATPLKQHTAMGNVETTGNRGNAYNRSRSSASEQRWLMKHIEDGITGVSKVSARDGAGSKQYSLTKQMASNVINTSAANGRKVSFSTRVLGVGEEQSPSRKTVHIDGQTSKVSGHAGVTDGTVVEGAMAAVPREDNETMEEANFSSEERVNKARKRRKERQAMRMG